MTTIFYGTEEIHSSFMVTVTYNLVIKYVSALTFVSLCQGTDWVIVSQRSCPKEFLYGDCYDEFSIWIGLTSAMSHFAWLYASLEIVQPDRRRPIHLIKDSGREAFTYSLTHLTARLRPALFGVTTTTNSHSNITRNWRESLRPRDVYPVNMHFSLGDSSLLVKVSCLIYSYNNIVELRRGRQRQLNMAIQHFSGEFIVGLQVQTYWLLAVPAEWLGEQAGKGCTRAW